MTILNFVRTYVYFPLSKVLQSDFTLARKYCSQPSFNSGYAPACALPAILSYLLIEKSANTLVRPRVLLDT